MSPASSPEPFFKKAPSSLFEELSTYQKLAKEADQKGNQKLAARWQLATELILGFLQYLHFSRNVFLLTSLSERASINDRTIEVQEIAQYTTSSLAALTKNDFTLAQQLMSFAQETQEAGVRCRHWLAFIKTEIAKHHTQQELTFDEAAAHYRSNALKAREAEKKLIAQHWIEAACLAEEASRKKEFSTSAYVTSGNQLLSSYWELSTNASYDASKIKAQVALALEQDDETSAQEYDALALLAERLAIYRENLVRSMLNGEITTLPHWKNAAELLSKSLEIARTLKSSAQGEPISSYQKMLMMTAQQAADAHTAIIPKLQKRKKPSLILINLTQQSHQEAIKAFNAFQKNDLPAAARAEKKADLYNKAAALTKKAIDEKSQWRTLGIAFLYWKYQAKKIIQSLEKEEQ